MSWRLGAHTRIVWLALLYQASCQLAARREIAAELSVEFILVNRVRVLWLGAGVVVERLVRGAVQQALIGERGADVIKA